MDEENETTVMISPSGPDGTGGFGRKKRNWRNLPIGEWQPLLNSEETLENVFAVFPAGVYLKMASNVNRYHVELLLEAPGKFFPMYHFWSTLVGLPDNALLYFDKGYKMHFLLWSHLLVPSVTSTLSNHLVSCVCIFAVRFVILC